jgi:hypothetical protein
MSDYDWQDDLDDIMPEKRITNLDRAREAKRRLVAYIEQVTRERDSESRWAADYLAQAQRAEARIEAALAECDSSRVWDESGPIIATILRGGTNGRDTKPPDKV